MNTEHEMPARRIVVTGIIAACGLCLTLLALVLLVLPPALQAAPDLRALPAIVSAAQFEMQAEGVGWYWCH